jgi:hypothetical protein
MKIKLVAYGPDACAMTVEDMHPETRTFVAVGQDVYEMLGPRKKRKAYKGLNWRGTPLTRVEGTPLIDTIRRESRSLRRVMRRHEDEWTCFVRWEIERQCEKENS